MGPRASILETKPRSWARKKQIEEGCLQHCLTSASFRKMLYTRADFQLHGKDLDGSDMFRDLFGDILKARFERASHACIKSLQRPCPH